MASLRHVTLTSGVAGAVPCDPPHVEPGQWRAGRRDPAGEAGEGAGAGAGSEPALTCRARGVKKPPEGAGPCGTLA